jgi:hypothetical protein
MRQRGDLVGGQAGDFHHRLAGNAVASILWAMRSASACCPSVCLLVCLRRPSRLPFLRPTSCNLSAMVINLSLC